MCSVHKIFRKFLKNILINDEHIFEKYNLYKLYKPVSAPVSATRDALAEMPQSLRDTASLLYNRMMENTGYGKERLKDIEEKEAKEEEKQQKKPAAVN